MEKAVLLADDEMIVRKGLSCLFLEAFAIKSIDHISASSNLMSSLRHKEYSHLIVETSLPDGPTSRVLSFIRELYPKLQVMVYSRHDDEYIRRTLLALGIYYVSKKSHEEEQIRQFGRFFNNEISQAMFKRMERDNKVPQLTPREFEIYLLLLQDKSTNEIAKELNIKKNTVSTIKRKILNKQNVTNWRHLDEMSRFHLLTVEEVN